jgi:hypothetical protein
METRRGRESRSTEAQDRASSTESSQDAQRTREVAETATSRIEIDHRMDVAQLIVRAMAYAERYDQGGRYSRDLRGWRLLSGSREYAATVKFNDSVDGITTYSPQAPDALFRRPGESGGIMTPSSVGTHYPMPAKLESAHGTIAMAWLTYGEIARAAMDYFPAAAEANSLGVYDGEIVLSSRAAAEKAALAAVREALRDPLVSLRAQAKWAQISSCQVPTEKSYFLRGITSMKCGPMEVDFRAKSAKWQGAPYISMSGIQDGTAAVAISRGRSDSTRVAESESRHRRQSETSTTRRGEESSTSSSSSASMRRSSASGTTHETSSGAETQTGVSVSPR